MTFDGINILLVFISLYVTSCHALVTIFEEGDFQMVMIQDRKTRYSGRETAITSRFLPASVVSFGKVIPTYTVAGPRLIYRANIVSFVLRLLCFPDTKAC